MSSTRIAITAAALATTLAGCAAELGSGADRAAGVDVRTNERVQIAAAHGGGVLLGLSDDFRRSAPDMINFAFDSVVIDPTAQRILDQQAAWIIAHPAVRLRIYGNTDLVGSGAYNYQLGLRRAEVVARYLVSRGISSSRLERVVSYGETRPIVPTDRPERLNRRTVTEVVGFVPATAGFDFDGKVAERVYRAYVSGETPRPVDVYDGAQVFVAQ